MRRIGIGEGWESCPCKHIWYARAEKQAEDAALASAAKEGAK